eukprot:3464881-Rhodomonas_salina.1
MHEEEAHDGDGVAGAGERAFPFPRRVEELLQRPARLGKRGLGRLPPPGLCQLSAPSLVHRKLFACNTTAAHTHYKLTILGGSNPSGCTRADQEAIQVSRRSPGRSCRCCSTSRGGVSWPFLAAAASACRTRLASLLTPRHQHLSSLLSLYERPYQQPSEEMQYAQPKREGEMKRGRTESQRQQH